MKRTVKKRYEIENFPISPIPAQARSNWVDLTIVWAGFVLAISNFLTGSLVSGGLGLMQATNAIMHGNVVLFVIAAGMGFIAQETGHSLTYTARYAFGVGGSKLLSALFSLTFIGWAAIGIGLAAASLSHFIHWNETFLVLMMTMLFAVSALYGFRGLVRVSAISIPVILLGSAFGINRILALEHISLSMLAIIRPAEPMPFGSAVSIVVGSWILGAVASPDVLRYARRRRDVVISMFLTFVVLASLQMWLGAVMGLTVGASDLPEILYELGFGVVGVLLLVFLSWSTSDNNFYAAGLGISNFLDRGSRILPTAFSVGLAGVLALAGLYRYLGDFLQVLSVVFAPIGGVCVVDYALYRLDFIQHDIFFQGVRWKGVTSLALGITAGALTSFSMPFLVSFGVAGLCYALVILLTPREYVERETDKKVKRSR